MTRLARTATLAILLSGVAGGAVAHEAEGAAGSRSGQSRDFLPINPVSLIEGSQDAWSVSETSTGCYLMSPQRKKTSRVAIGRNPEFGLGMFAVNVALSIPGTTKVEKVGIRTDAGELAKDGRLVGADLLFMPMSKAEVDQALRTLAADGRIWLVIRSTWMSHAGLELPAAIAAFRKQCDERGSARAPTPVVAATTTATVGSKAANPQ